MSASEEYPVVPRSLAVAVPADTLGGQLNRYRETLGLLDDTIDTLTARLEQVLTPADAQPSEPEQAKPPFPRHTSGRCEELGLLNDRLHEQIRRLVSINGRVDV